MGTDLTECPRCGRYARAPVHLVRAVPTWPDDGEPYIWRGGWDPWPELEWCTPEGFVVLPFRARAPVELKHKAAP